MSVLGTPCRTVYRRRSTGFAWREYPILRAVDTIDALDRSDVAACEHRREGGADLLYPATPLAVRLSAVSRVDSHTRRPTTSSYDARSDHALYGERVTR